MYNMTHFGKNGMRKWGVCVSLTIEEEKAIVMAIARGRMRSYRQRLANVQERGERDFARDGFTVHEAKEMLEWANREEVGRKNPMVRLVVDEELDIVGINHKQNPCSPVLRWASPDVDDYGPDDGEENEVLVP